MVQLADTVTVASFIKLMVHVGVFTVFRSTRLVRRQLTFILVSSSVVTLNVKRDAQIGSDNH
jgi:hypothetical protein